jgi:PAS domain S-box-containing protein
MIGTVGCGRDVTDKKKSEELLRRSEEKFRTMFERHNAVMLLIDPISGSIIDANNAAERFYCYTKSQLRSMSIQEINILPPDEVAIERNLALSQRRSHFIFPHRLADGAVRTVEVHSSPIEHHGELVLFSIIYDITERELAEKALRESEDKFAKVFNYAPVLITLSNIDDGAYVDVNDKFCEVSGFTREASIGKTSVELGWISPKDRMLLIEELQANGSVRAMDLKLLTKDKREIQCIYNGELIQAQNGQMLLSIAHDITERKRMEILLKEINAFLDKLIDAIPLPIFYKDTNGLFVGFNKSFEEFYGKTRQELIGKSVFDIYPEELAKVYYAKDNELFCDPGVQVYSAPIQDGRGVVHDIVSHKSTYLDSQGHVKGLIGVILDVTEKKRAEEALRLSEGQKNAILNGITTNIAFVDDKLQILWVNKAAAESGGRSQEEMIGATCHSLWADPARPCENCPTIKAFQTKKSEETIMTTPDGRIWNEKGEPIFDDLGNLVGVVELAQDITEFSRLTNQEKLLITAIHQAAEAVIITDATGVIQYVNPAQESLSGYTRDELVGQNPNIFKSDFLDDNFYDKLWETINSGKVWSGRFINRKKDGTEYKEDTSISPVYNKSGHLTNFVAVKHDVTKQIEIQEQLFQAQKMEAIGTLAGGFAHDFNNKLQVIAGYVELILFDKDLPETLISELDQINQTVVSCTELIKGMMVFSRKTPVGLQPIAINKIVEQTRSMLTRSMPKMIEIDLLLEDDLWTINAAPNQIDQILMNLAINARDAMQDGGRLTIKTQNLELDEVFCRSRPGAKPGRYVLIEVSDTGTGMDKETASHIFEPFFTTKASGKGTGLGLAVVYGIVEQHNGWIICDSAPSVGSTFKIYFPAIDEVHEKECFEKKEPPKGKGETILLVDDEPDILEIIERLLNRANYRVITSIHGKDALELYEKHRKEIRLVILDLLMPGMGGKECLRALFRMDPNSRVLMVSGYHEEGITEKLLDAGAKGFIWKPFDEPQLLEKIRAIIDAE